jgi:hypothetical protein
MHSQYADKVWWAMLTREWVSLPWSTKWLYMVQGLLGYGCTEWLIFDSRQFSFVFTIHIYMVMLVRQTDTDDREIEARESCSLTRTSGDGASP